MEECILKAEQIEAYGHYLHEEERAGATAEKYLRSVRQFAAWLGDGKVTKDTVTEWKEQLVEQHYAPTTINAALAALNGLFRLLGWNSCRARFLKIQRRTFRDARREMNCRDYKALIAAAREHGRFRLALLMECICATGIRVSELKYITVEAVIEGRAEIALKGKIRTIILPQKLCRKLMKYAKKQGITSGSIFLTKKKKPLTRRQIWAEMKRLCVYAKVDATKVFPHNLRHLFATTYYKMYKDIAKLADVLGHSSIETTRIYLLTSGEEHQRQLERLGLVS